MYLTAVIFMALAQPGPSISLARTEALAIRAVTPNRTELPCYGLLELALDFAATYDNPFNPEDIDVYALFTPPGGGAIRVNGFLNQPYARRMENGGEYIDAAGAPFWQLRFTPHREGAWQYQVFVKDRAGGVSAPAAGFTVTPSAHPGFIRRNTHNPRVFAQDNGAPFFAIGENMCWPTRRGSYDYEDWLSALGKAGGNWIRVWMFRWHGGLEATVADQKDWEPGRHGGLGVYNLANAWKIDNLLGIAEKNNVQVMLCLGTYGEFINGGFFNEGLWDSNPYNAANGGPCATPEDFWTNPAAKKYYQQRLRYQAARYGAYTNLFAWEFFNEAYPTPEWTAEMAAYLKGGADPYRHLVSTTYGKEEIWKLPDVDFTMSHKYGTGDISDFAPVIFDDARQHRDFGKPHLMAEFGLDFRSSDDKYDTTFQGVNLHNALWASLAAGNGGGAMIWYWDSYVHPGNLYGQFASLRKFTDQVPWNEGEWKPLNMTPPEMTTAPGTWRDLTLTPTGDWEKNPIQSYAVHPLDGVSGAKLPKFLFGSWKPELRAPLVFKVNFEQPGRFEVRVSEVSTLAQLQFTLDAAAGSVYRLSALPQGAENPNPEYASTALQEKYGNYLAVFHKCYGMDVPAGEHTLTVDVTEGDWASIEAYVFRGYVSNRFLEANYAGIGNGSTALAWVQNAAHHWKHAADGATITPLPTAHTLITGLADGNYTCCWWDTWKGEETARNTAACAGGRLDLPLPEIAKDTAILLRKEPSS